MSELREPALHSNAWPFVEARRLRDRFALSAPPSRIINRIDCRGNGPAVSFGETISSLI